MSASIGTTTPAAGLADAEAARRLAGRGPTQKPHPSRSYASIVFTAFNLILAVAGAATLVFGEWQDALLLGVLVANAGIGTMQEVRAKRALDQLSALRRAAPTVVRDGVPRQAAVEKPVRDDLVRIGPGDQVVADGTLEQADQLRLDESILTDESRPVARTAGVLVLVGLYLILALEAAGRVRGPAVTALCLTLLASYVFVLLVPFSRQSFSLALPGPSVLGPALAAATLAIAGLAVLDDRFVPAAAMSAAVPGP